MIMACWTCYSTGKINCPECGGLGGYFCRECKGMGMIEAV